MEDRPGRPLPGAGAVVVLRKDDVIVQFRRFKRQHVTPQRRPVVADNIQRQWLLLLWRSHSPSGHGRETQGRRQGLAETVEEPHHHRKEPVERADGMLPIADGGGRKDGYMKSWTATTVQHRRLMATAARFIRAPSHSGLVSRR